MQRHTPADGGLGQAPAERVSRYPVQAKPGTGLAQRLVSRLPALGAGGAAGGREQGFGRGRFVAVLSRPRGPVGVQGFAQGGGDRNLSGPFGLGGGGPIAQAAVHIGPAQGQGF